ncbi:hypothetical protein MJD09_19960 [bacterium]|nr:hypothetical protein [bacterium]
MDKNSQVQDPYSKRDYWVRYFESKTQTELQGFWTDFESFSSEIEDTARIVMSSSRVSVCQEVLWELLQRHNRQVANHSQIELF